MSDPIDVLKDEAGPEAVSGEVSGVAPEKPSRFRALKRLIEPTELRPEQFRGDLVAQLIGDGLDERMQSHPAAREAMVGESLRLCWSAVLGGGSGNATPIGYLIGSGVKYAGLLRMRAEEGARVIDDA